MKKLFLLLISLLFVISCEEPKITTPEYTDGSILENSVPVDDSLKSRMEGIYSIVQGQNQFGNEIVIKWVKDELLFYGRKHGTYIQLKSGIKNGEMLFEGVWRYMRSVTSGKIRLKIAPDDFSALESGAIENLEISGSFSNGEGLNTKLVKLKYKRPFSPEALNSEFLIVAHRGGVRNSDEIGISENSIEMIAVAEKLGANAIEIDVKLSKDNIPFLYHDPDINLRLVQEPLLWGLIEEFTFAQIETFLTLVNGEKIPKLKDALEFVLNETNLKLVWLDMKSSRNAMPYVIPIQQEILARAEAIGRNLKIVIGLPTEEKMTNFMQYPDYQNILSLNELGAEQTRTTNSLIWGPRWTLGSQTELVREMHSEGKLVITWTLDQDNFISEFINNAEFDGFVTNYPTVVAYYHYAR